MGPLCPISIPRSPVTLLKFQMSHRIILIMSSGSKNEPRYACLSEFRTSHSHRMWAKVSSSVPHLHCLTAALIYEAVCSRHYVQSEGQSQPCTDSRPIIWSCLLTALCPVRRPVTVLYWQPPHYMKLSPHGIISSQKASHSPGLCPFKGQKPSVGTRTRSQNYFSSLPSGVTKTSPPYPMLINQLMSNPSEYILCRDSQGRFRSKKL